MATTKTPAKSKKKSAGKKKYGTSASKSVEREMKAMKEGKLRSGSDGSKVTNPKQAIAIGLSEARRAGGKVPPAPKTSTARPKDSIKKASRATR